MVHIFGCLSLLLHYYLIKEASLYRRNKEDRHTEMWKRCRDDGGVGYGGMRKEQEINTH